MCQFPVARLIDSPAAADFLLVVGPLGIIRKQRVSGRFELVDLPSGARLVPIQAASLDKKWARDLQRLLWGVWVGLQHHCREQAVHAPIEAQEAIHVGPRSQLRFFDLHHHIQDGHG